MRKILSIGAAIVVSLFLSCTKENKTNISSEILQEEKEVGISESYFYVGTYTDGESKGIYRYSLKSDGTFGKGSLVAETTNPSFLTKSSDNQFLIAVGEVSGANGGVVQSYKIESDSLVLINESSSGGESPCFVAANPEGYVLAANYTGGNVGLLKLGEEGHISDLLDLQQHTGKGTTPRQEAPHAHSAWFAPSNDGSVVSVDLGTNQFWFSKIDVTSDKLIASDPQTLTFDPGAGPRHLSFHPNGKWVYVLNELNATVALVQMSDEGEYDIIETYPTLPDDFKEFNKCADIHVSHDGKFLYASNRGHNSIVIFAIDAQHGKLSLVGHEPVHGNWPRNFSLSPDDNYLLVANRKTNNIVSFARDQDSGKLTFISEVEAPSPVCIAF